MMKQRAQQISLAIGWMLGVLCFSPLYSYAFTYQAAEQQLLQQSYSSQAFAQLEQAARLDDEAVKHLGRPRVDLNVRAYAFRNEVDLPLSQFKNNLEHYLGQGLNQQIEQWQTQQQLPSDIVDPLKAGVGTALQQGIGLLPDQSQVILEDQVIRPTVSVMMPLYSGGLIGATQQVAQIEASRSQLSAQQQQDLQRFSLIQAYFYVQLQQRLLASAQLNLIAMQGHYDNAIRLERQGFISKGQRMEFEVARNNAQRTQQTAYARLDAAQFQLSQLLQGIPIATLDTPLFVNHQALAQAEHYLQAVRAQSPELQKLQLDQDLAGANVKLQQAGKKPQVFAFGEYSLDEQQNWIVGVAARYNLYSGTDQQKKIQAAQLKQNASALMSLQAEQDLKVVTYKAYREAMNAQQSDLLFAENLKAAQEHLRIQQLAFKEDMGTASQVIDAQNTLSALHSEIALNAYQYVIALATLLQSHGGLSDFAQYIQQPNTHFIR